MALISQILVPVVFSDRCRDATRYAAALACRFQCDMTLLHVFDQRVRGLAIGMSSHGIGTSRALQDDPVAGAFSGLAMALNALVTAVVLPLLLATMPWMLNLSP